MIYSVKNIDKNTMKIILKTKIILVVFLVNQCLVRADDAVYNPYSYDILPRNRIYSYHVKFEITHPGGSKKICSGALITNQWVLTSCKLFKYSTGITAYLGNGKSDGFIFNIQQQNIIYPSTNKQRKFQTIQLIKLPHQIKYTRSVQPINLPWNCDIHDNSEIFIIDETDNNLQTTVSSVISVSKINKFAYSVRSETSPAIHQNRIIILPQGKLLIGIFNDHNGNRVNNPNESFTFHHILEYSRFISDYTGLNLPNC